jgi:hypothetical protein
MRFIKLSLPNTVMVIKSWKMRWVWDSAEMSNAYKILIRKPEGRTSLGRPRCRWGIILKGQLIRGEDVNWIHLVMNFQVQ